MERCVQFGHWWLCGGYSRDLEDLPEFIYCEHCDTERPIAVLPEQLKI